jgi:predicted nucleic acid-binding protein
MAHEYLFIDTSAFYSFFDKSDKNHQSISQLINDRTETFITSNFIVDELVTLLRVRHFEVAQIESYIEAILQENICQLLRINPETESKAWTMLKKYKDVTFSYTDCTSFILMKEHKIKKAISLDEHFVIAGFELVS